jgi:hypothetical protein
VFQFLLGRNKNGHPGRQDPIATYLEAYQALQLAEENVQILVASLERFAFVLCQAGAAAGRNDAWKITRIQELGPSTREKWRAVKWSVRLAELPTSAQLLEAIADWRKKREAAEALWNGLSPETRAGVKPPEALT